MILIIANLLMNAFGISSDTAFKYARRAIVGVFALVLLFVVVFTFKACDRADKPRIDEKEVKEK